MAQSRSKLSRESLILKELISLKKRREIRITKNIREAKRRIEEIKKNEIVLRKNLSENASQWRIGNKESFSSNTGILRKEVDRCYSIHYQNYLSGMSDILQGQDNVKKLEERQQELEKDLKISRAGQEKLRYVLEKKDGS